LDDAAAAALAPFFLAGVFFLRLARAASARRLRRAFFFAWPLRCVIFVELRESNFPMSFAGGT
jgi:hypothetical protein